MNRLEDTTVSPFDGIGSVSKLSLPEQVYISLREALMSGRFAPGQRVPLRVLASVMGTSTMPVREAVNRLVATGALELLPNRRVCVPVMSTERYLDLTKAKIVVESAAAQEAVHALTDDVVIQLESLHQDMCQVTALEHNHENVKRYLELNKKFHFTIYGLVNSSTLINLVETLWLQVGPYFNLLHEKMSGWRGNERHEEIIAALRSRDPVRVGVAMRADLEGASKYLLEKGLA